MPSFCDKHFDRLPLLADNHDLTQTKEWKDVESFWTNIHGPSFGLISSAEDLSMSPDGKIIAFTASIWHSLQASPTTHIYTVELETRALCAVTHGTHNNKRPKWSPNGKWLLFLSDRQRKGQYQLHTIDTQCMGEAKQITSFDGVVEDFELSNCSTQVLIGVAGVGLPKAGFEGSGAILKNIEAEPSWMPHVKTNTPGATVRSLWLYNFSNEQTRQVSLPGRNVWRFTWCGPLHAIILVSNRAAEGSYKEATLAKLSLNDGSEYAVIKDNPLYMSELTSSPTGSSIAFVESVGGDRTKLAGSVLLLDPSTYERISLPSMDVDVSCLKWINEQKILAIGLRHLETVAIVIDITSREAKLLWTTVRSCGNSYPKCTVLSEEKFSVTCQGWDLPPEIGIVKNGVYQTLVSFQHDGCTWLQKQLGPSEPLKWKAPDGLEIEGFLYHPVTGRKPYPLVLNIHGGPISAFIDQWLGYRPWVAFLVAQGYAVLNVNPRGSTGRGQKFTSMMIGDIGGADAQDLLSGIDYLTAQQIADPARLGVIGGSYGGFMTAWLTTITTRFAAAIPISPVTDWKLQWLSSDLRQRTLDNKPYEPDSLYVRRSPLQHVARCKTPTLQLVGMQDSCTPPEQAHHYHTALVDHGVKSTIVEYPLEGH